MIRRLFRLIVLAGVAAGVVAAVRALTEQNDPLPTPAPEPTGGPWPPLRNETAPPAPTSAPAPGSPSATVAPEPAGVPVADEPAGSTAGWVEPTADGTCPAGHPLKANMKSKIYHSPGQLNYDRTVPDRCYADAEGAESDGLRAAKR